MIWLCHPGSFTGEEVCADNPFRETELLEVDLRSEAMQPDPDAARKGALLFDTAQKHQEAFGRVCAYAATRAWLRRARSRSRRPAIEDLADFFEPSPFHWKEADCRGEITQTFLWLWRWTDEQVWNFAGRRQRVGDSLAKVRDITMPEPLREYLQKLRAKTPEEPPQIEAENEELRALRIEAAQYLLDRKDATSIISTLLEKNGDVDTLTATCGRPLLSIAAVHAESAPSVELLLACKADVHTAARDGREPLHYACGRGDAPLVRRLLSKMANPNGTCEMGRTPADEAILTARDGLAQDVCRVLREAGVYEDDHDKKEWVKRSLKDSNEDAWRADHEDIELYPIPGR